MIKIVGENKKLLREQYKKQIIMLSIRLFEEENRMEIQALYDRLVTFHESLFDKLDYRNLVIFLYQRYRS
jgi:hypothetical protein